MKIFKSRGKKGVMISLISLSNALDLSAIDQLPLCEGGHITAKSGGISENDLPSSACRWLIDNEQESQIKLTLHELTRDCIDSEDEIYLLDGERSIFGPFCAPVEQRYRRETFSKDVNFDYEIDLPTSTDDIEGVFNGDAVEVVYVTAPGGHKFRFKFYFEWELIEMPSANGTVIEIGNSESIAPFPATGVCGPEHIKSAFLGTFASKLDQTIEPESAMESYAKLVAGLDGFGRFFDSHFAEYCKIESTKYPCEFFHYPSDISAQELFGHLDALVEYITSNCDEGFGYLWREELSALAPLIGGDIPTVMMPDFSSPVVFDGHLCQTCRDDFDCGDFNEKWMRCSPKTRQCICANHWVDANGNLEDGCETFSKDYSLNHDQCAGAIKSTQASSTKTTTTPRTTTSSRATTTTTATRTYTTTTEAPGNEETTVIVDHANVFNVDPDLGDKCPPQWLAMPMEADDNVWNNFNDHLHESDVPMCAFANLPACTKGLFVDVASSSCHSATLISNYNAVVDELARVSVSGDFDRTCKFVVARAPCAALDFKAISDAREFAYKFADVVKTYAIEKCGKDHLKNSLAPMLMQNIEILDNAAQGFCPGEIGDFLFDGGAFDNTNFASMPIFATTSTITTTTSTTSTTTTTTSTTSATTTTVATTTTKTTTTTSAGKFVTLKDGLCAAKAFGRLSTVVFNANAFDIVDAEVAKKNFKEFADEIGKLGKKTAKLEGLSRSSSGRPKCKASTSGKMPCDLLEFPSKEKACQLATRAKYLFLHVRSSCNDAWIKHFGVKIQSLIDAAQPISGSCPELGERMGKNAMREYAARQEENNGGISIKEQISEVKQEIKEEGKHERAVKSEERKKKVKENKSKKAKRDQEKLKNMVRRRMNTAALEVNKKNERLEQMKIAIAAAEAGNFKRLETMVSSKKTEAEQKEEPVLLMDSQDFEYYEYESEEDADCAIPVTEDINGAVAFFSELVEAQASPLSKLSVTNRVKRRFKDVLNFIRRAPDQCPADGVFASCSDVALVYGNRRAKVPDIIEAASRLVKIVEHQCEGTTFAELFISMQGKADEIF